MYINIVIMEQTCLRIFKIYKQYETNGGTGDYGYLDKIEELITNNQWPEALVALTEQIPRISTYTKTTVEEITQEAFYNLFAAIRSANGVATNTSRKNSGIIAYALQIVKLMKDNFDKPLEATSDPVPDKVQHEIYTRAVRYFAKSKDDKGKFIANITRLIEMGNGAEALITIGTFEKKYITPYNGALYVFFQQLKECLGRLA